ncbi:LysR family transcriptional regulator [Chromobacterium phragmitis]|uniref:LysR family transcriptional regulator n=1 Tax=Chromobacterium amazonense TaxID=1382803 RepID=UPI0021B6F8CA|nr:LysR family transcriptional regulator [Chromobacterium amazonense]MBM2885529.1 LysR family transcriptional regulator [Chromobacterium amazonense]MDE1714109.1 LysR family transcriptional regulator [Chromobacterium amazonense]
MLDDLDLFVAIVDAGSLRAAALRLEMPAPTLTRRLQALEARLGCKLLNRSARRMVPSNEGWQYYEQCKPLLAALRQATASLDATLNRVEGVVRLMAPLNMANDMLLPLWERLLRDHPQLRLELKLNNNMDDLYSGMADLALRVGEQTDPSLQQRRVGAVRTILVAAPGYLEAHGEPERPAELAAHRLLMSEPFQRWKLRHRESGEEVEWPVAPCLQANDMLLTRRLAEAGAGIAVSPLSICHRQVADGSLCRVLEPWEIAVRPVYAVWPQRRALPARVRVVLDALLAFAAAEPRLQE